MKKIRLIKTPIRLSDIALSDLYEDASDTWQDKAARLQIRRWRKLKHQLV